MARAISTQVKEFMDMWLSPSPPPKILLTQPVKYTVICLNYPYSHTCNRRKYEYTVKDGFQLMLKTPWDIDLMGNYITSNGIKSVLKELAKPPDYEELNKYKQIVIHRQTYTGVFNMECGTEDKVIEITISSDEKHLQ